MNDIDIFRRTLKCKDLPLESEIEIFEVESLPEEIEEEGQIEGEVEPGIDPEALYNELECLKRRLQKLLLLIKKELNPCLKSQACPESEVSCKFEKEICALQKAQHKLQCEVNELVRCLQIIREEIKQMHVHLCKQNKDIEKLRLYTRQLQYYQLAMTGDEGVCHQRYMYLKEKKANWKETEQKLKDNKHCPEKLCKEFLSKQELRSGRNLLQAELENLKTLFVEVFEMKDNSDKLCFYPLTEGRELGILESKYIEKKIKENLKFLNPSCVERLKCDKIVW